MTRLSQSDAPQAHGRGSARARPPALAVRALGGVVRRTDLRALYRGVTADGRPVLLDVLLSPRAADVQALVHEYELTRQLASPAVLRALALTAHEGRPALVFEDFGGRPLDTSAPMPAAEFLLVAERVAAALAEIHRASVIHKDLSPANVLVDPESGAVKIAGLGLATRLSREVSDARGEIVAGSLPYISPEQTGRMNRAVDSRSDLYALGVVFFEMLTARRPFEGRDVLEWVHCHVARPAPSPRAFVPLVPEQLAAITQKLLAKRAEDRYQTASGLVEDLARCRARLIAVGSVEPFPLATRDLPDTLRITQKLYGRAAEIAALERAFARVVAQARPELALVSGAAGTGKSVLVHELLRSSAEAEGGFLVGKVEQYDGSLVSFPLADALRPAVRELLGKDEPELALWRDRLREALGPNARLVTDLVPELGVLLGPQPDVPSLGLLEDERRFHLVFARFVRALMNGDRPLVLFLDDLQWADDATLRLLEHVVAELGAAPLLVVGAYRDNELGESHALHGVADRLRAASRLVEHVRVAPLSPAELTSLVVDTLHRPASEVRGLVAVLHEKTGGNPFFATQFLRELFQRRMLYFDQEARAWRWDEDRIAREGYTDNVVDLMVGRFRQLPTRTLELLELAAVAGSAVRERALVTISGWTADAVQSDLAAALEEGLLVRAGDGYRFAHDRVQQAAYSLIPEADRPRYHARVGRLLLESTPEHALTEHVFEIASHLNAGRPLLTDEERERLPELNLLAGRKAKAAAAYVVAADYLATGVALLHESASEERRAPLAFALGLERARCELLAGDFDASRASLASLARSTRTKRERADLTLVEILFYVVQGDYGACVSVGLACLRHFGVDWSNEPARVDVEREHEQLTRSLAGRSVEELVDLPVMTDPDAAAVMDVLCAMKAAVLCWNDDLFYMLACLMARTSIEYGNAGSSGFGYLTYAMALVQRRSRPDLAYRFAKVGHAVSERLATPAERGKAHLDFAIVSAWSRPLRESQAHYEQAIALARQSADVPHACYAYMNFGVLLLLRGAPLAEIRRLVAEGIRYARATRFRVVELILTSQERLLLRLEGRAARRPPAGEAFDEARHEDELRAHRRSSGLALSWHHVTKLVSSYLAGRYEDALVAAKHANEDIWSSMALLEVVAYRYHHALTRAALCDRATGEERAAHLAALREELEHFRAWAEHCPENFTHAHALLSAEAARIEGDHLEAERAYERAIEAAREEDFIESLAIGLELAGRYWLGRGFRRIGEMHLRDARDAYLRWGARGKAAELEALAPTLAEGQEPASASTLAASFEVLDLLSVMKASRSIAEETELDDVVRTLIRVVIEQSVAQRGYLLLAGDAGLVIRAEACATEHGVDAEILSVPAAGSALVPEPLVNYVWRSRSQVVVPDASAESQRGGLIPADYLARVRPKSVLSRPIVRRGQIVGALYLENNLVTHAFTPDRVAALDAIAAQAAISLEITSALQKERSARAALARSEARFRRVYESNMIGILYGDLSGKISDANDYVLDTLRCTRADLEAGELRWPDLTSTEDAGAHAQAVAELRATRVCQPFEREYVRKDGTRVPILIGSSLLEGSSDELATFVLDDTERQRLLREERQARADAEEAVRAREDFMAIAAHELRTPLTPLKLQLQMLQRLLAAESDPSARGARKDLLRLFESADRQVDRLTRLVNDLLDLSRLGRGRISLDREDVDLSELAREVAERYRADWTRAGSTVVVKAARPVRGSFDRQRVEQVVVNLLANAVKYGAGRPVDVVVAEQEGRATLTVRDRGIGISEEDQARIFERFARAVSVKHFGGFGLGLYICREIVRAHAGAIRVESRLGEGATFVIELPLVAPAGEDEALGSDGA